MLPEKRVTFEHYSFPMIPGLIYEKDGNDHSGHLLFIDDPGERFSISFESGMGCIDLRVAEIGRRDFASVELALEHLKIHLCYPVQDSGNRSSMGYFHVEMWDKTGRVHVLPGQMRIEPPIKYEEGLRTFSALRELISGLRLEQTEEPA